VRDSSDPTGVEVVSVEDASAADEAGMAVNDVITKFGSTAISSVDQLRKALAAAAEDSVVTVTFRRDRGDTDETTDVTIRFDVVSRLTILGVTVQDLSSQLADQLGYPALGGVQVKAAMIGGPAFDAGVMPRDVIFSYGGVEIEEVSDLVQAVREFGGAGTVTVGHERGGDLFATDVTLRGALSGSDYTTDVGLGMVETLGGLLVVEVVDGTVAQQADIQLDDIIYEVQGNATLTPQEFFRQIDEALDVRPKIDGVTLTTLRNGVTVSRYMTIRTSSDDDSTTTTTTKEIRLNL